MDWFLHDKGLHHERVHYIQMTHTPLYIHQKQHQRM